MRPAYLARILPGIVILGLLSACGAGVSALFSGQIPAEVSGSNAQVVIGTTSFPISLSSHAYTLHAGRIENGVAVGSLTYAIDGHAYPARLLSDGFWWTVTRNEGGQIVVDAKDAAGRALTTCVF